MLPNTLLNVQISYIISSSLPALASLLDLLELPRQLRTLREFRTTVVSGRHPSSSLDCVVARGAEALLVDGVAHWWPLRCGRLSSAVLAGAAGGCGIAVVSIRQ